MQHDIRPAVIAAFLLLAAGAGKVEPKGPNELPKRLEGLWKVSLCINPAHCWIRFEQTETGEVHTLGRYPKGVGGKRDPETGEWLWPDAELAGLQWDLDLQHEQEVQQGKYRLLSVLVKNPPIYRGRTNGFGHGYWHNNCATYARDAWHYYSGEGYPLPRIHTPDDLLLEVLQRHPELRSSED